MPVVNPRNLIPIASLLAAISWGCGPAPTASSVPTTASADVAPQARSRGKGRPRRQPKPPTVLHKTLPPPTAYRTDR